MRWMGPERTTGEARPEATGNAGSSGAPLARPRGSPPGRPPFPSGTDSAIDGQRNGPPSSTFEEPDIRRWETVILLGDRHEREDPDPRMPVRDEWVHR